MTNTHLEQIDSLRGHVRRAKNALESVPVAVSVPVEQTGDFNVWEHVSIDDFERMLESLNDAADFVAQAKLRVQSQMLLRLKNESE